jgi:hypothetical protein
MYTVRVKFRLVKLDPVTSKPKQYLKEGPIFNIEANSRANAQGLIKDALKKRGVNSYSIVPAANGDYLVYADGGAK